MSLTLASARRLTNNTMGGILTPKKVDALRDVLREEKGGVPRYHDCYDPEVRQIAPLGVQLNRRTSASRVCLSMSLE